MLRIMTTALLFGCLHHTALRSAESSPWIEIDRFEKDGVLNQWSKLDVQNETEPHVDSPQVLEIVAEQSNSNHYLLKKPAADGIVGNRKALAFRSLPRTVAPGEVWTFFTRISVEKFPNNHSFGLASASAEEIAAKSYDAFEPMIRITDKVESDGAKNDGRLMVSTGHKSYEAIRRPGETTPTRPLDPGRWYDLWYVVDNRVAAEGGQSFRLYIRGSEFTDPVLAEPEGRFRIGAEAPLRYFITIANTGPANAPYGNGGVRYDDLYMSPGIVLTTPTESDR